MPVLHQLVHSFVCTVKLINKYLAGHWQRFLNFYLVGHFTLRIKNSAPWGVLFGLGTVLLGLELGWVRLYISLMVFYICSI